MLPDWNLKAKDRSAAPLLAVHEPIYYWKNPCEGLAIIQHIDYHKNIYQYIAYPDLIKPSQG